MSSRRDRGTTILSSEERARRVGEAKRNIRETATFTPALLGRIESRIDSNAFRRCISDNTIYHSLCNSLKDKNLPERERHPDLVDFLALEAIVPVNYDGEYNRVLKDLFIRCHTESWVEKAILEVNHDWFQDQLNDARKFIETLINNVDSQLLEIILEDLETNFWRERLQDHALYARIYRKVLAGRDLSQRDVLTVVALNGGKYPTEIFRHLIVNQNSAMLNYGSNIQAQHALYEDDELQGSLANSNVASDSIATLESITDTMQNMQKRAEVRKKIREIKELMKDDYSILHRTQGGRVSKGDGGVSRHTHPAPNQHHRDSIVSHNSSGLFMRQEAEGNGGYYEEDQGQLESDNGHDSNRETEHSDDAYVKREEPSPPTDEFLGRSF
ncbi:hypothetical protein EsH8_X_000549 [Colletotrichum jinshuiense]